MAVVEAHGSSHHGSHCSWRGQSTQLGGSRGVRCYFRGLGEARRWKGKFECVLTFVRLETSHNTRIRPQAFSSVKNEQYRKLFGVDIFDILSHYPNVRCKEVLPKFLPWVEVRMVECVQSSDVVKFEWWADAQSTRHPPESMSVHCRWS